MLSRLSEPGSKKSPAGRGVDVRRRFCCMVLIRDCLFPGSDKVQDLLFLGHDPKSALTGGH
jgi:hypothetical protein